MDPTITGGLIAAAAGAVTALVAAVVSRRNARDQRAHERTERRYDDLKAAYVRVYTEVRELVEEAEIHEYDSMGQRYAASDPPPDVLDHLRYTKAAEQALGMLRLFADDALYKAGRAWLDGYYARFWDIGPRGSPTDVAAAEAHFVAEGKRALEIPTDAPAGAAAAAPNATE